MKREILFKAKREDNSEWIEGSLVKLNDGNYCIYEFGKTHLYSPIINPETVGQFTGLLDKNGVKIFEHDEITVPYGVGKVSFYNGCFMIEWTDDVEASMELLGLDSKFKSKRTDLEVTSNIHES